MQAIKTRVEIPDNHLISFSCYIPDSIPSGTADVMLIFETGRMLEPAQRILGSFKGKIKVADDFDSPLSEKYWLGEEA